VVKVGTESRRGLSAFGAARRPAVSATLRTEENRHVARGRVRWRLGGRSARGPERVPRLSDGERRLRLGEPREDLESWSDQCLLQHERAHLCRPGALDEVVAVLPRARRHGVVGAVWPQGAHPGRDGAGHVPPADGAHVEGTSVGAPDLWRGPSAVRVPVDHGDGQGARRLEDRARAFSQASLEPRPGNIW